MEKVKYQGDWQIIATFLRFIVLGKYGNRFNEIPIDFVLENGLNTINTELSKKDYAVAVQAWLKKGASIVGGCCGIGPEYIKEIKKYGEY